MWVKFIDFKYILINSDSFNNFNNLLVIFVHFNNSLIILITIFAIFSLLALFDKGSHDNFISWLSDCCCGGTLNFTWLNTNISICFEIDCAIDNSVSSESFLWNSFAVDTIQTRSWSFHIFTGESTLCKSYRSTWDQCAGKVDHSCLENHLELARHKEIHNYQLRNMMVTLHFCLLQNFIISFNNGLFLPWGDWLLFSGRTVWISIDGNSVGIIVGW